MTVTDVILEGRFLWWRCKKSTAEIDCSSLGGTFLSIVVSHDVEGTMTEHISQITVQLLRKMLKCKLTKTISTAWRSTCKGRMVLTYTLSYLQNFASNSSTYCTILFSWVPTMGTPVCSCISFPKHRAADNLLQPPEACPNITLTPWKLYRY